MRPTHVPHGSSLHDLVELAGVPQESIGELLVINIDNEET